MISAEGEKGHGNKTAIPFGILCIMLLLATFGYASADTLTVAVEDEVAPWSQKDGSGFANDIVKAAFKASKVDIQLQVVPYSRCRHMVVQGEVAACFSMSWVPELEREVVFSAKPLFVCYSDYFVNTSKPMAVSSENDIPSGTTIGTVINYEYPPSFYNLKRVVIEESISEKVLLKKLAAGRIDLAIINYNETKPYEKIVAEAGVTGRVKPAFRSGILKSFIGFSEKHPQGQLARKKFNEGYKVISANGVLDKIRRQWIDKARAEIKELNGGEANSDEKNH